MTLLLRPRHFFAQNPALDVPPSVDRAPSEVKRGAVAETADKISRLAFDGGAGLDNL
jgi:primary-amine oxidase